MSHEIFEAGGASWPLPLQGIGGDPTSACPDPESRTW